MLFDVILLGMYAFVPHSHLDGLIFKYKFKIVKKGNGVLLSTRLEICSLVIVPATTQLRQVTYSLNSNF